MDFIAPGMAATVVHAPGEARVREHVAPASPTRAPRNPGIDLLRGLSIALVVLHHVDLRIPVKRGALAALLPGRLLDALVHNGYEAVFVFFVISGFLITSNTRSRWGRLGAVDVRSFYVRRAARIVPCLVILVVVLAALHLAGVGNYVIRRPDQSLPRAILAALGLHLNWYEGHTGYLPASWDVLWSLSIEEVFYLGFPLLCLGLRRDAVVAPVMALLALSLPVARAALEGNAIWQEKAYLPGMAAIAAGIVAALVAARPRPRRRWITSQLGALGTVGLVAVLGFEDCLWPLLGNGTMLVLTTSAALLVLTFHWRAGDATASATRPLSIPGSGCLRSFGRLSYEIYLTHMFVILPVVSAFKASGGGLWWGFVWYAPALALSWLLGWLVAKYVSVPCDRAVRRWLLAP